MERDLVGRLVRRFNFVGICVHGPQIEPDEFTAVGATTMDNFGNIFELNMKAANECHGLTSLLITSKLTDVIKCRLDFCPTCYRRPYLVWCSITMLFYLSIKEPQNGVLQKKKT